MRHKIAIIVSEFNQEITGKLLAGAHTRLLELGIDEKDITIAEVPGAVEIPLIAQLIAKNGDHKAIIALGCVIRGETSHYDYVCELVSQGCLRVMLDFDIPVIFGILTTENEEQAHARAGGAEGNKGADAADAALSMLKLIANDCQSPV